MRQLREYQPQSNTNMYDRIDNITIKKILDLIKSKYGESTLALLKVYVDEENDKYYITVFAAHSFGVCSLAEAFTSYENGQHLLEISKEFLAELKAIFGIRLIYEKLYPKNDFKKMEYINYMIMLARKNGNASHFVGDDLYANIYMNSISDFTYDDTYNNDASLEKEYPNNRTR